MQENNNSGQDVDLFNLLISFKRLISKWKMLIIAAPILGILTGVLIYKYSPKEYLSRMLVTSNLLKGPAFVVVVDDIQRQIKEGNIEVIKKSLNVNESTALKIKGLRVFSTQKFVERQLNTDIPEEQERGIETEFVIEAYVSDNAILPELEKGLLYYFQNNYYMKDKGERLKQELRSVENKIDRELLALDSLKMSLLGRLFSVQNSSKVSNLYVSDPGKMADYIVSLYRLKMETEDRIIMTDVKIVEKFMPYKKPYSPKPFFTIVSWFFTFTILAVIIIALVELGQKLKEKERNL